jgi:hypothetical protein
MNVQRQASRWETFVWPRWLPVRARMPLVAQVTGAVALTALIVGPWWASTPDAIESSTPAPIPTAAAPSPAPAAPSTPAVPRESTPGAPAVAPVVAVKPAHLNLDVRHNFGSVDFAVSVDGKPALLTKLDGSGKRFGVFGKRAARGYTKTLELSPGVHLVRVRVSSPNDKFDQMRVERFDLGSSAVASMRISADKSGLSLVAERPPAPEPVAAAPVTMPLAPVPAPVQTASVTAVPQSSGASRQDVNAVADLLQSVRSMLIAIAGFVASAATGFIVQEYLRSRRSLIFAGGPAKGPAGKTKDRRPGKARPRAEDEDDDDFDEGFESAPEREDTTA